MYVELNNFYQTFIFILQNLNFVKKNHHQLQKKCVKRRELKREKICYENEIDERLRQR